MIMPLSSHSSIFEELCTISVVIATVSRPYLNLHGSCQIYHYEDRWGHAVWLSYELWPSADCSRLLHNYRHASSGASMSFLKPRGHTYDRHLGPFDVYACPTALLRAHFGTLRLKPRQFASLPLQVCSSQSLEAFQRSMRY